MTPRVPKLIAEIDEFKGYWNGMESISYEALSTLRVLATIESVGSSSRIEGAGLSNPEVSALREGLEVRSFWIRDEQEVAGYAKVMQLLQESAGEIDLTENNFKYLYKILLSFSTKNNWHLGQYKKHKNHVTAFDSE